MHKDHLPPLDAPELVIVAGVSGSGKSSFIKQIKSGCLPKGVVLPDGVQDWPVVGSSRPVYPPGARGFILHYDMNGRGIGDGANYRDDPALVFVPRASALTVINLRPSLSRLMRQLTERQTIKIENQKREQNRLIWRLSSPAIKVAVRIVPRRLAKAISRRTPFRHTVKGLQMKLRIYDQPGWLDDIYARWAVYLDSVAQTGKPVRQLFVEPNVDTFSWRLISTLIEDHPRMELSSLAGSKSIHNQPVSR